MAHLYVLTIGPVPPNWAKPQLPVGNSLNVRFVNVNSESFSSKLNQPNPPVVVKWCLLSGEWYIIVLLSYL